MDACCTTARSCRTSRIDVASRCRRRRSGRPSSHRPLARRPCRCSRVVRVRVVARGVRRSARKAGVRVVARRHKMCVWVARSARERQRREGGGCQTGGGTEHQGLGAGDGGRASRPGSAPARNAQRHSHQPQAKSQKSHKPSRVWPSQPSLQRVPRPSSRLPARAEEQAHMTANPH